MNDTDESYLKRLVDTPHCGNRWCSICSRVRMLADSARLELQERKVDEVDRMLMDHEWIGE